MQVMKVNNKKELRAALKCAQDYAHGSKITLVTEFGTTEYNVFPAINVDKMNANLNKALGMLNRTPARSMGL